MVSIKDFVPIYCCLMAFFLYLREYFSSTATSTCLTLREVGNELREVTEWYQLGLQLGVTPFKLREIERDYPQDTQRRKSEIHDWWLRNAPEASWEKLAQALEAMGGHTTLACRLRNKVPLKGRFSISTDL